MDNQRFHRLFIDYICPSFYIKFVYSKMAGKCNWSISGTNILVDFSLDEFITSYRTNRRRMDKNTNFYRIPVDYIFICCRSLYIFRSYCLDKTAFFVKTDESNKSPITTHCTWLLPATFRRRLPAGEFDCYTSIGMRIT